MGQGKIVAVRIIYISRGVATEGVGTMGIMPAPTWISKPKKV